MNNGTVTEVANLIDAHISSSHSVAEARKLWKKRARRFRKLDERLSNFILNNFHGKVVVRGARGYFYDDSVSGFWEYPVVFADDAIEIEDVASENPTNRELSSINPEIGMDVLATLDGIAEGRITL